MTFKEFEDSLLNDSPPGSLGNALRGLWFDRKGDWDQAHRTVQDDDSSDAAWVHAYLHRREGDAGNAAYWYARAGKTVSTMTLEAEWREIAKDLLQAPTL